MVIEGTQASSPCPDTGPRDGCTWWSVTFRDVQSSLPPLQSHRLVVHPSMAEGHLGVTPSATHSSLTHLSFLKQHTESS